MKHKVKEDFYKGEWTNGRKKGKGISYLPGKSAYFGDFDGVPHGKGKQIYIQAKITYWGEFDQNKVHGLGRAKHDLGHFVFEGRTDHGIPI
jgi:hypothetical protein